MSSSRSSRGGGGGLGEVASSSSSSSSSSARRAPAAADDTGNNDGGEGENGANGAEGGVAAAFQPTAGPFKLNPTLQPLAFDDDDDFGFKVTDRQMDDFHVLSPEVQTKLVRTCLRVCLMKGGRNEVILRSDVGAALAQVDPACKRSVPAVLAKCQQILRMQFGMGLVSEGAIVGVEAPNDSKLYLFNLINSPRLSAVLAEHDLDRAFKGFAFIVMHAIWSSSGRIISQEKLLQAVRSVDGRFPTCITNVRKAGSRDKDVSVAVAELGLDFISLMNRCKKEGYVGQSRAEGSAKDDENAVLYSLGSRFFVELGKEALVESYYAALGQEVDAAVLKEVADEDKALRREKRKAREAREKNTPAGKATAAAAVAAAASNDEYAEEEDGNGKCNGADGEQPKKKEKKRKNEI